MFLALAGNWIHRTQQKKKRFKKIWSIFWPKILSGAFFPSITSPHTPFACLAKTKFSLPAAAAATTTTTTKNRSPCPDAISLLKQKHKSKAQWQAVRC